MLSGPRRRAAKGRFAWSVTAVVCSSRHVFIAALIWGCVRGVRVGVEEVVLVGFVGGGEKGM